MTTAERGTCPRCQGPHVHHHVFGLPSPSAFLTEDGDIVDWVTIEGCVVLDDEPRFDRRCEDCRHRWNAADDAEPSG
ncbi:hypothetical protein GGQ54_002555 [Naumannella cuiyingiana]|uniref:Uncharacterized protein n=1 Tax=Naumannella cuiyingiana TaxID=1347891 RepID=A0A7Z0DAH9_9ACTN|nr:hypothetical protein [Naumannella cuiyingiana]NYI71995.1 hypothetical protein [Naumannella cuiyingiana]